MQLIYCLSFDYPPDYFATVRVDCFMEVYEFSKQLTLQLPHDVYIQV